MREVRGSAIMSVKSALTVGETLPKTFLLGVEARGDRPAIREKRFGIWKSVSLAAVAGDDQGDRLRARRDRLQARRRGLDPEQHRGRMGLRRHGRAVRRRRLVRHLSDRLRQAGRISRQRQPHQGDLRRGRRAARQGAGVPRPLSDARKDRRVRHGGAGRLRRSDGGLARRVHHLRPPAHGRQARACGSG